MTETQFPRTKLLKLTEELDNWIIKEASKMGMSQSAFIRMTLISVKERVEYNESKRNLRVVR